MTNSEKFPENSEVKINYPAGNFVVAPWEETLQLVESLPNEKVSLRTQDGQYFVLPNNFVELVDQPEKKTDYVATDLWQDSNGEVWQYDTHHDVYFNLSRATPQRSSFCYTWKRLYIPLQD